MKVKTILRRPLALALSLLLCAVCLTPEAAAVRAPSTNDDFDPNEKCSITISYPHTQDAVDLPYIYLYKVAEVNKNLDFTPTGSFDKLDWLKKDLSEAKYAEDSRLWGTLTDTLKPIAEANAKPVYTQQMSKSGTIKIDGLEPGLYLVTGDNYHRTVVHEDSTSSTVFCTPESYLVCLPQWVGNNITNGKWEKHIEVKDKVEETTDETVNIRVIKVWADQNGNSITQPEGVNVTVRLMRGGVIVDTVILNKDNNWRHDWVGLDNTGKGQWSVMEQNVPSNYRPHLIIGSSGNFVKYVVENTYTPPTNPPYTPPGGKDPDDPPEEPDIPLEDPEVPKSDPPEEPLPPDDEVEIPDEDVPLADLPQTGQLWWPVPFLAVGGMFFLLIGAVRRRRDEYEE